MSQTIPHDMDNPQWFATNVCDDALHDWSEWHVPALGVGYEERDCRNPGCDMHEMRPLPRVLRVRAKRD